MKCFIGETKFKIEEPTVVTIGKFDGRHKGHQKLLSRMLEYKKAYGYQTAVFTFDMAPVTRLSGTVQKVIALKPTGYLVKTQNLSEIKKGIDDYFARKKA